MHQSDLISSRTIINQKERCENAFIKINAKTKYYNFVKLTLIN